VRDIMMKNINVAKATVLAIIILFIGISFLPNIPANINKYSEEDFSISITKPENAIYRNNQKIIPFFIPLILRGSIDIEIKISPPDTRLDRIEVYVNNGLFTVVGGPGPFDNYLLTLEGIAFSRDMIKVVGYGIGDNNPQSSDGITIWRIFS
jgi:hypothetical protein